LRALHVAHFQPQTNASYSNKAAGMSRVEDKLDNLIFTVAKLAVKIENFDKRFDELESKFDQQYLKLKKESKERFLV